MSETAPEDDADEMAAPDEWLSAPETFRRIVNVTASPSTDRAITQRAHAGLLRAKALMLIVGTTSEPDAEIPTEFWEAGNGAFRGSWQTGDFETEVRQRLPRPVTYRPTHMRALGVSFHLGDLRKVFPDVFKPDPITPAPSESQTGKAGRPPAEWWDDLWVEMCRSLYAGDLQPKRQVDIENAMNEWIAARGESAATSTVRGRARKLWQAILQKDEN